jgi:DNA helicase II / ATP-dependent DNA helicase PcrA
VLLSAIYARMIEEPALGGEPDGAILGTLEFRAFDLGFEPAQVEVATERVQVLTAHGAKGLEWDVVFVAH